MGGVNKMGRVCGIERPGITYKSYMAFRERKHFKEWVKDDRCVVSYKQLYARLYQGWGFKMALTTPVGSKSREFCKCCGVKFVKGIRYNSRRS